MTDLWNKDADPSRLEPHYSNAVDLLARREVFEKTDVAVVIALHAQEIERLTRLGKELAGVAKDYGAPIEGEAAALADADDEDRRTAFGVASD